MNGVQIFSNVALLVVLSGVGFYAAVQWRQARASAAAPGRPHALPRAELLFRRARIAATVLVLGSVWASALVQIFGHPVFDHGLLTSRSANSQ